MNKILTYIYLSGSNWGSDKYTYQLLFSTKDKFDNFDDDSWGFYPATGRPNPPSSEEIVSVVTITTEIDLILAQNSKLYRMYDAIDGITPLGYENIDNYDVYPEIRLVLNFGDDINHVLDELNKFGIIPDVKDLEDETNN